jgi:hypothetical protein
VLDVLRVLGRSDGRHDLVQHQLDRPHPRPERYLGKGGPVVTTHPMHSTPIYTRGFPMGGSR